MTNVPIVILPGMDGTGDLFKPFVTRLVRRRPVEVIPYPRDLPLDYPALTAYVTERLPRKPYVILGESFSGPIAIEIAARDTNVCGLILVSSFARHPLPAWLERPSRLIDVRRLPVALIEAAMLGSDQTPGLRERLAQAVASVTPAAMRARTSAVLRIDQSRALKSVSCPILALAARKDLLLGGRGLRSIRTLRPDCDFELIDGPHMLLGARPDAAAAAIERFCARRVTPALRA